VRGGPGRRDCCATELGARSATFSYDGTGRRPHAGWTAPPLARETGCEKAWTRSSSATVTGWPTTSAGRTTSSWSCTTGTAQSRTARQVLVGFELSLSVGERSTLSRPHRIACWCLAAGLQGGVGCDLDYDARVDVGETTEPPSKWLAPISTGQGCSATGTATRSSASCRACSVVSGVLRPTMRWRPSAVVAGDDRFGPADGPTTAPIASVSWYSLGCVLSARGEPSK